jgi:two-component system, LuxR family, response regulator FixJ
MSGISPEPVVAIVDDDEAVLDSLAVILEAEGFTVAAFASARAFLDRFSGGIDGCVVTDLRMPEMDGLDLLRALGARPPMPPVIMITAHGDVPLAVRAMKHGALDFIEKPFDVDALIASIRAALEHRARPGGACEEAAERLARLTGREREVLEELVIGRSNKEIARTLDISPRTVEVHRARVMEKMEAQSLSQLVRLALSAGVDPGLE